MSLLDDFNQILREVPPHPVAPENRGLCRLVASAVVPAGSIVRMAPQPDLTSHEHPLIVMNTNDVHAIRTVLATLKMRMVDIDQQIADCAEQLFAEREAREGR